MADAAVAPARVSALAGIAIAGHREGKRRPPGVIAVERGDVRLLSVQARRGKAADLAAKIETAFGLSLPSEPRRVQSGELSIAWTAPEQWLVISTSQAVLDRLRSEISGLASTTDQSDSRAVIEVSGTEVRRALEKGVMIDLHPRAFKPGDTAVTSIAHIGAQISMLSAAPVYELLVPRSFCLSFWDWMVESAAEFGFSVENPR